MMRVLELTISAFVFTFVASQTLKDSSASQTHLESQLTVLPRTVGTRAAYPTDVFHVRSWHSRQQRIRWPLDLHLQQQPSESIECIDYGECWVGDSYPSE